MKARPTGSARGRPADLAAPERPIGRPPRARAAAPTARSTGASAITSSAPACRSRSTSRGGRHRLLGLARPSAAASAGSATPSTPTRTPFTRLQHRGRRERRARAARFTARRGGAAVGRPAPIGVGQPGRERGPSLPSSVARNRARSSLAAFSLARRRPGVGQPARVDQQHVAVLLARLPHERGVARDVAQRIARAATGLERPVRLGRVEERQRRSPAAAARRPRARCRRRPTAAAAAERRGAGNGRAWAGTMAIGRRRRWQFPAASAERLLDRAKAAGSFRHSLFEGKHMSVTIRLTRAGAKKSPSIASWPPITAAPAMAASSSSSGSTTHARADRVPGRRGAPRPLAHDRGAPSQTVSASCCAARSAPRRQRRLSGSVA